MTTETVTHTADLRAIPGLVYVADYPPALAQVAAALLAEHPDLDVQEIARRMHAAGVPRTLPAGLDARPTVRCSIHCSHCAEPHRDGDYNSVTLWSADVLSKLGDYELDGWRWNTGDDPEMDGRVLVCEPCWSSVWCDTCGEPTHAWQERAADDHGHWHTACGKPEPLNAHRVGDGMTAWVPEGSGVPALLSGFVEGSEAEAKKCPRCGKVRLLGRFDVCVPCAALCGWDPVCEACQQDDAGGPVTVAHVPTCGGGLA